jgi:hypothetical protein
VKIKMACSIVEEFPFLKDKEGLGDVCQVMNVLFNVRFLLLRFVQYKNKVFFIPNVSVKTRKHSLTIL